MKNETTIRAAAGSQDFFIERCFQAPAALVFRAFSEPELYSRWMLPADARMRITEMDCRSGGSYKHSHQGPNNMTFGFQGVYHEVVPGKHIIKTSEFTGLPDKLEPVLEITRFSAESEESCCVTIHTICPSVSYRDNMIAANMEPTLKIAHQQLQELLEGLKQGK